MPPFWQKPRQGWPLRRHSSQTTRRPSEFRTSRSRMRKPASPRPQRRSMRPRPVSTPCNRTSSGRATERKRQEALLASKATTHQELETAVADADRYQALLAGQQADLARAQGALASSRAALEAAKGQRAALDTKDALYRAEIQAKEAAIIVANVNLGYTRIVAPAAGAVSERHVQEGQLVAPGMELVDLVRGDVWIQANYQETQLTNIQTGDRRRYHHRYLSRGRAARKSS